LGGGCDLNQIKADVLGQLESFRDLYYADLLTIRPNEPDFSGMNAIIDSRFRNKSSLER